MFCANCGTKQNEGEKFCPNCGMKFEIIPSHNNDIIESKQHGKTVSGEIVVKNETFDLHNSASEGIHQIKKRVLGGEDKYAHIWQEILQNKNNISFIHVDETIQSGVISDIVLKESINVEYELNYKNFNSLSFRIGTHKFCYLLNYNNPLINEIERLVHKYNAKAIKNKYDMIEFDKSIGYIKAQFKEKFLTFSLWDPFCDFENICKLCEKIKR